MKKPQYQFIWYLRSKKKWPEIDDDSVDSKSNWEEYYNYRSVISLKFTRGFKFLQYHFQWSHTHVTKSGYNYFNNDISVACTNGAWNSIRTKASITRGKWLIELRLHMYNEKPAAEFWNIGMLISLIK